MTLHMALLRLPPHLPLPLPLPLLQMLVLPLPQALPQVVPLPLPLPLAPEVGAPPVWQSQGGPGAGLGSAPGASHKSTFLSRD